MTWLAAQVPTFDFNDILPIAISASRGAIHIGNPSTSTVVVLQFKKGNGEYGIGLVRTSFILYWPVYSRRVQCSNPVDVYRQVYSFRFRTVSIRNLPNPDYRPQSLALLGAEVVDHLRQPPESDSPSLFYIDFWRFIQRLPFVPSHIPPPDGTNIGRRKSKAALRRESTAVKEDTLRTRKDSQPPKPLSIANAWDGLMRYGNDEEKAAAIAARQAAAEQAEREATEQRARRQEELREEMWRAEQDQAAREGGVNRVEYAAEPILLDATALEVRYYVDVPGL